MIGKIKNFLFYLVLFSIPLNLGKHFIFEFSYINSRLIDYVIPTIYIQDILVFLLVLISLPDIVNSIKSSLQNWEFAILVLFFGSLTFSVFSAPFVFPALYFFLHLQIYALFGFYAFSQINFFSEFPKILRIFVILAFFQSTLGICQWVAKGSIFDNYLFFGEQPYSISTPGIAKTSLGGISHVLPYGTFRHPNTLAGFLVFCLLFILGSKPKNKIYYSVVFLSFLCLLLTFSFTGLISLFLGLMILFFPKKHVKTLCFLAFLAGIAGTAILILTSYFLIQSRNSSSLTNNFSWLTGNFPGHVFVTNPSIYRRGNLLLLGLHIFSLFPLFGVGLNNSLYFMDKFFVQFSLPRFVQPVHNVYLLLLAESGIISVFLLFLFFALLFKKTFLLLEREESGKYPRLLLALLATFLFSAFFDHYLLTSQQILLLFCLTVGLVLQYNSE